MREILISLVAAALIIYPCYIYSKRLAMSPKMQKKAMEKAVRKGHVVTAKLASTTPVKSRKLDKQCCKAIYSYQFEEKQFKYCLYTDYPPYTLRLYFLTNPQKAGTEGDIRLLTTPWLIVYTIAAILCYCLICS